MLVVALLGLVAGVLVWSGITLSGDATALARVDVQPFGGGSSACAPSGPTAGGFRSRCETDA